LSHISRVSNYLFLFWLLNIGREYTTSGDATGCVQWNSYSRFVFSSRLFLIDLLKLHIPKYRNVTVTIVTICDSVLWRLKAVTMRLILESFKSQVLARSFWDFCDGQLLYYTITLWRSQMWPFVMILWLAKSGHNENG
jgi:hypothetical protein